MKKMFYVLFFVSIIPALSNAVYKEKPLKKMQRVYDQAARDQLQKLREKHEHYLTIGKTNIVKTPTLPDASILTMWFISTNNGINASEVDFRLTEKVILALSGKTFTKTQIEKELLHVLSKYKESKGISYALYQKAEEKMPYITNIIMTQRARLGKTFEHSNTR